MADKFAFFRSLFTRQEPLSEPEAASIPSDPFTDSRCGEKPVILYFAPHQDDELLTLGVDACRAISSGEYDVHIILCTDGSKSNKRFEICNGKACRLHPGIHQYELSIQQFIAARDREFRGSCDALGYEPGSIHFFPRRSIDSMLSVQAAEATIRSVLAQFPGSPAVRTLSPFGGKGQHKDHRNLGQAALNLYRQGVIRDLKLFIEPYCVQDCNAEYPELALSSIRADEKELAKIRKAIASYSNWEPEAEKYAIGYHSVTTIFNDFTKEPVAWYHLPEASQVSEV